MNKNYYCRNGAFHTNKCCDTCWNLHPSAKADEMFLGTSIQRTIMKEKWINKAMKNGFTNKQAIFLYEIS